MCEVDRQLYAPSSYIPHIPHSLLAAYCAIGVREELDAADIVRSMTAARALLPDEFDDVLSDDDVDDAAVAAAVRRCALLSKVFAPPPTTFPFVSPSSAPPLFPPLPTSPSLPGC